LQNRRHSQEQTVDTRGQQLLAQLMKLSTDTPVR
jgi:hypothetical protein